MNEKIKNIDNITDKKITYQELIKELNEAYKNKKYDTVICIVYSLLEDLLLLLLSFLNIIKYRENHSLLNPKIDNIIRPILQYKILADTRVYKLNLINVKLKILSFLLNCEIKDAYIDDVKKVIGDNIGIQEFLKEIKNIEEFINLSNEIIHFSFNKNIEVLKNKKRECAENGYFLSKLFMEYVDKIKKVSLKEKYEVMINNLINSDTTDINIYYKNLKNFPYYNILDDTKYLVILKQKNILNKIMDINYKKLVKEIINNYEKNYHYELLFNKREYIKKLINGEIDYVQKIVHETLQDNTLFLYYLTGIVNIFRELKKEYKNNLEFIEASLNFNGNNMRYISREYRNNKSLVLLAVKQNGLSIRYASDALRNDKDVALAAIKNDSRALEYVGLSLRDDYDIVYLAVKENAGLIRYASMRLRNNKDIALEAVSHDAYMLRYISDTLRDDKDVIRASIINNCSMIKYASETLKNDKELMMICVELDGRTLKYASDNLKNDKEIVMKAITENARALKYASFVLQDDKEIVITSVKQVGLTLSFASERLKNDKEIVLEAVKQHGTSIKHASDALKNDREVVMASIKENSRAISYVSNDLKRELRGFVKG